VGNTISYIYHEAEPGSTGRAEIELYLQVKDSYPIKETAWQSFVNALAEYYEPKRFATRRSLYARMDKVIEADLALIGPIILTGDSDWSGEHEKTGDSEVRRGLVMLGRGVMLTQVLRSLGSEWENRERLLVPLDVLGEFGLRDNDFTAALEENSSADRALIARVIRSLADDAAACFLQGSDGLSMLGGPVGRSTLLFALQWKLILLRVAEACKAVLAEGELGGNGGVAFDLRVLLRTRDRYRLMRQALMLDGQLLRKGLSV